MRCQQSHDNGTIDIALIGDSHVEHIFPGIAKHLPTKNVVYYAQNGLPLINNNSFSKIFDHTINTPSIKIVILNAYWQKRIHKSKSKLPEMQRSLADTVARLVASGKKVYLIDDIPDFPFEPSRCRLKGSTFTFPNGCAIPRQDIEQMHQPTLTMLRSVTHSTPGVHLIETYRHFCGASHCSMTHGDELLYRDTDHLNITGSLFIGREISSQLAE